MTPPPRLRRKKVMSMKNAHYREYRLLRDTPELSAGSLLKWNCWTTTYSDIGDYIGTNPPKPKVEYSREFVLANPKWFEAVGKPTEWFPTFPTEKEFYDENNGHYFGGSTRHNDMCRLCQVLHGINWKPVDHDTYTAIKKEYLKLYSPLTTKKL